MYQSFQFFFPTRIYFGVGESEKAAEYVALEQPKKVFVCTYADVRLPVLDLLLKGLEEKNIPYVLHNEVTANPKAEQIEAATERFIKEGCDFVMGVGGGSVIDSSKGIALYAANDRSSGFWPYVSFEKNIEKPAYPVGLVVTIASTGSESNESMVVTDKEGTQKMILNHESLRPRFSICDPKLSITLPARQTALGAADILSHILEQYLHCDQNVESSDRMSFGLMESVVQYAPVAMEHPDNLEARSNLLWCSILAMSRLLGVGHNENWLTHMLEHAVSAKYNIAHGAGMTALLPAYVDSLEGKGSDDKMKKLADLFGADTAGNGLRKFFKALKLPVNLTEALGFTPDDTTCHEFALNAIPWGAMEVGGYGMFSQEDAEKLFKEAR